MVNDQKSSSSPCNAPFKDNDFIHNIISFAQNYLDSGLSVLPTRKDKSPAMKWGDLQKQRLNNNEIENLFGQPEVTGLGIICGKISGNLEVIDIDCKNDPTGELWSKVYHLAKSAMPDLFDKLVIAKTVNNGYHLYYRCQTIERNQQLSKNLKNEVLTETRSEGGYVIAAPSEGYVFIQGNHASIPEIKSMERESLLSICRSLNESLPLQPVNAGRLSAFDDFNQRGDIIAILERHHWNFVSEKGDYIYFTRPGKASGNISASYNKRLRLFYPFTTSSIFDANRGYNAVQVYTVYEAGDDSSRASQQLYDAGYGDRHEKPFLSSQDTKPTIETEIKSLPIDGFPQCIQDLINICVDTYRTPRDFWAGAVMIASALAIGDKVELITKYKNVPLLWMGVIGEVSSGKTEAMEFALKPFADLDALSIQQWKKHYKVWEKEKGSDRQINKPEVFQYLLKDTTPEAMAKVHELNQRGILIYYDELKGWIDNFNRYNKNGEESFIVSAYTRSSMTLNRKTGGADSIIHIANPLILVLGSIQPGLLTTLAADNRQENGFLSRFCFIWPVQQDKPNYTKSTVPDNNIDFWKNFITNRLQIKDTQKITLSPEAELLYEQWFNKNCELSNKESSGYLKGVYGKLDIIALRVAVVLYGMSDTLVNRDRSITGQEMSAALEIVEYFRATALKVYYHLFKNKEEVDLKKVIKLLSQKGNSQKQVATIIGVSQPYVNKILKTE